MPQRCRYKSREWASRASTHNKHAHRGCTCPNVLPDYAAALTIRAHRSELLRDFLQVLVTSMISTTTHFGTSSFKKDELAAGSLRRG